MSQTRVLKQHRSQASSSAAPLPLSRKEQRRRQRAQAKTRQQVIQFCAGVLVFSGLVALLLSLAVEPKLGVAAGFGLACMLLSFKYPRYGIYGFIMYLPFSGSVTYALGGSAILQLAKDALFFPALLGVFLFCQKHKLPFIIPQSMKTPFIILMTYCAVVLLVVNGSQQLSANGEQPILVGILGLKALVGYLFLITCIYYLLNTKQDMYFLLRLQVILIIICCGLAFAQYLMLRTGICSPTQGSGDQLFKASLETRCLVGGSLLYSPQYNAIRLPGTFVAPWQWGWFLISSAFFAFGTAFNDRSLLWRVLGLLAMAVTMMMSLLSGQRIALMLVPVVIVILLVLTGQILNLKRFLPIGIGLALILGVLAVQNAELVSQRIDNLQGRWEAAPPTHFIIQQLQWAMDKQQGLLGRGLGRATNAARIFGRTKLVETYHSKILYEISPIGLILVLSLFTVIVITTFRAYRSIKDPNLRGYGASMWVYILFISYFPYYYPLDVDPVNVFYWLAIGIILKLPDIDRQERAKMSLSGETDLKLSKQELKQLRQSEQVAKF